MLKSYISIAIRNILREKFYSILNIAGLAIGMMCFILIGLWVKDELSYDRHFKNHDRIFRIESSLVTEGVAEPMAVTDRRLNGKLQEQYRHVCESVSMYKTPTLLNYHGKTSYQEQTYYADPNFFHIFSYEFLYGDGGSALIKKGSVVISEDIARLLFGDKNPVGDTLKINNLRTKDKSELYIITGVIRNSRRTSHIHPTVIFRKDGIMETFETVYVLLKDGYVPDYFAEHVWKPLYEHDFRAHYIWEGQDITLDRVQPITAIHLGGTKWDDFETNGNRSVVYVFTAIGLLILLLACINYINLATARSFVRAREIGVRRALGAGRRQIIVQFLVESVITCFIALILALSLAEICMPLFSNLAEKEVALNVFDPLLMCSLVFFAVVIGVVSGIYPAFYISSFPPTEALKGIQNTAGNKRTGRRALIVVQFSISIAMFIATIVITQQLRYLKKQNLGFDTSRMMLLDLNDERVNARQHDFKNALMQNKNVLRVTMSHNIQGNEINHTYIAFEDKKGMHGYLINSMFVDPDFLGVMQLKLKDGRDFDSSMLGQLDTAAFVIINESARKFLGYDNAIGKKLNTGAFYGMRKGEIIGVVEDFHASSLHSPIQPLVLALGTLGRPEGKKKFMTIKIAGDSLQNTIAFIEKTYKTFGQGYPFQYNFLDEAFNANYRKEEKQKMLFAGFAVLSIFSSLLGLVGLASFFARLRAKEIAIRRISGAEKGHIIRVLAADFIKLTVLAWLVASPLTYFVMGKWLNLFAYRIDIDLLIFLLSGAGALLLVFSSIAIHTLVVVKRSPAKVLKYE